MLFFPDKMTRASFKGNAICHYEIFREEVESADFTRFMTDEEREALRDYDRERYAKKKSARLAKEEAERAKILAGTSFEKLSTKRISKDTQVAV